MGYKVTFNNKNKVFFNALKAEVDAYFERNGMKKTGNWKLYGKTGSCDSTDSDAQTGWFVGWIQKESRIIIFADYLEDEKKLSYSGGKQAKEQARRKLMTLIRL